MASRKTFIDPITIATLFGIATESLAKVLPRILSIRLVKMAA